MKIFSLLVSLALISVSSLATAQWQWKDKDGRLVFSDRHPPPEVMEKDIIKRPVGRAQLSAAKDSSKEASQEAANAEAEGTASPTAPALPGGVDKDLEAKKKQAADAEAAKKKAEEERVAKARIENCARAKQAMSNLESGMRISRTNTVGEREVMDDSARNAERSRIQTIIGSECR
jgi:hypothetical protein